MQSSLIPSGIFCLPREINSLNREEYFLGFLTLYAPFGVLDNGIPLGNVVFFLIRPLPPGGLKWTCRK